jgi:hypothetical protein
MPDQPTKAEMREWAIERLGLIYHGLTQTPECSGYWERFYEEEIEPMEWLLALIESSPESGEKRGEDKTYTSTQIEEAIAEYFITGIWRVLPDVQKPPYLSTSTEEMQVPAPSPAPPAVQNPQHLSTSIEVEEEMTRAEMFANCHGGKKEVDDVATLRAALGKRTVSREWAMSWLEAIRAQGQFGGAIFSMLRELGIAVEEPKT